MRKLLKSSLVSLFAIPILFFCIFVASYSVTSRTIPITFWDEMIWVGRSYFFQYYIHGDFSNPVWRSYESYDQPKLAEYAFGAWLYPRYLNEAKKWNGSFTYPQFLANDGLYRGAYNLEGVRFFQPNDGGPPAFWIAKYGQTGFNAISLVNDARVLNVLLLAGAAVFVYFFVLNSFGVVPAICSTILYGFNPLLLQTGLKAESEALFLFLFNASMLLMLLYFTKRKKINYLILFSICTGLTSSTKLNGTMLLVIFFVISGMLSFRSKEKRFVNILLGIVPTVLSLIIFVILNPFTFFNIISNTKFLFAWRMYFASVVQAKMFKGAALPDAASRVRAIVTNFFSPAHVQYFSGNSLFRTITSLQFYNYFLGVISIIGFIYICKLTLKKNTSALVILSSFIIIIACMSVYLALNWDRYYVPLPMFFVIFQTLGLYWIGTYLVSSILKKPVQHVKRKKLRTRV